MKSKFLCVALLMAATCFAQKNDVHTRAITPGELSGVTSNASAISIVPVLTDAQKLELRDAQRTAEKIEKQQSDLRAQFLQIQSQAQTQLQQLDGQLNDAKAKLAAVQKKLSEGVDEKKWTPDWEAAEFKPVPESAPEKSSTPKASGDDKNVQAKK